MPTESVDASPRISVRPIPEGAERHGSDKEFGISHSWSVLCQTRHFVASTSIFSKQNECSGKTRQLGTPQRSVS